MLGWEVASPGSAKLVRCGVNDGTSMNHVPTDCKNLSNPAKLPIFEQPPVRQLLFTLSLPLPKPLPPL